MVLAEKREILLTATGIDLSFKNDETGEVNKVLSNINLQIRNIVRPDITQGQVVSLVGLSGIGKTRLFYILAGLEKPDNGTVLVDLDQHPVMPGDVGIVTQNYFIFPWRKINKNLQIAAEKNQEYKSKKDIDDAINQYAELFNIKKYLNSFPGEISGGQRQRVCIVQQLLKGNKFLLMDEPFSGLDFRMKDKAIDTILKVSHTNEYKTIIIVSHDLHSTVAISDTIFLLSNKNRETEGATIIQEIDLIREGLAWHPDIKRMPEFSKLIQNIEDAL